MADVNNNAPKIHVAEFMNQSPELAAGKVELLGAFGHYMEFTKKITYATETEFRAYLENFKTLPV